jgi:hypothetical protein
VLVPAQVAHDLVHATALPGQDQLARRLAIVLVDRHLDLASPLLHHEQPADAMLAVLPRQQAGAGAAAGFRQLDVRADAPACYPSSGPVVPGGPPPRCALGAPLARPVARPLARPVARPGLLAGRAQLGHPAPRPAPGPLTRQPRLLAAPADQQLGLELFQPADAKAQHQLQQLMAAKRGKDAAAHLRNWLKSGLRQEGLQPSVRARCCLPLPMPRAARVQRRRPLPGRRPGLALPRAAASPPTALCYAVP